MGSHAEFPQLGARQEAQRLEELQIRRSTQAMQLFLEGSTTAPNLSDTDKALVLARRATASAIELVQPDLPNGVSAEAGNDWLWHTWPAPSMTN